ncbi:DUF3047 domain-containing protein [Balneola sp. MJW-20]|uniref:DUF3047 domain-containing protein n=1 Tax=Gracilimonas aurantiaca TaxID=3234185 RepID=UPI0034659DCB
MKITHLFALLLLLIISSTRLKAQDSVGDIFMIEDFENEEIGNLPKKWYNQRGNNLPYTYTGDIRNEYKYQVMSENGNKFLNYNGQSGKHLNYPLANKDNIDIYKTPVLHWRWRIHEIPEGANEDDSDRNDTAASIYVVFDLGKVLFKKVPKSIRYTWSSTLPEGKEMSKFYGNQKIIVIGSGDDNAGKWQTFERNIVEDYRRLFGDKPPAKPLAILILSDGDSTRKNANADYDDIFLKSLTID